VKKIAVITILIGLCFQQAFAGLKTLNCGTPRRANGDPGTTNFSISIILPSTFDEKPQFYLVSENIYHLHDTVTEPLKVMGQDQSGWWLLRGEELLGTIRQDLVEGGVKFFTGDKYSLWCR
jgi:hypothetical protein